MRVGAAGFIALLGAAAWTQPEIASSDLWWHLASGREIWATGGPPATDSFSFTFAGVEWLNHEWLWDAICWRLYAIDPQAVAWGNLLVLLAVFALIAETARRLAHSLLGATLAVISAAAVSHWFFDIRPHIVTLLFVSLILLTRNHPRAPWLWPPLTLLWSNLHGGFVFGIGMVGLLVLTRSLHASLRQRRFVLHWLEWASVALCLVAWMANPWGHHLLDYPRQYLDFDSPFRDIIEWHATPFSLDPRYFAGRFWLMAIAAAVSLRRIAHRDPFLLALFFVTAGMAVVSRRFIPLFAICAAPLLALSIATLHRVLGQRWPQLSNPSLARVVSALGLLAALWLVSQVRFTPKLFERWTASDSLPCRAIRYLEAIGPPERVLNEYQWGGYLMLHLPESKVFIDGRANTLYDETIFFDALALHADAPDFARRLARYPADAALLRPGEPFASRLTRLERPWQEVYRDEDAAILLPPGSPLLAAERPTPEQVLGTGWESYYPRVRRALDEWNLPTAIRETEAVIAADPLRVKAYGQLALFHAFARDKAGIRRVIDAGLVAVPRWARSLRAAESRAYVLAGDRERAASAFSKALAWGPFGSLEESLEQLRRLQAAGAPD